MTLNTKNIFTSMFFSATFFAVCLGQSSFLDRGVVKVKKLRSQPFEITEIKFRNQTIQAEEEFQTAPDWLKDLEIKVENTSSSTINYLEIQIEFPRGSESEPLLPVRTLFAGQNLTLPLNVPRSGDWLDFLPSKNIALKLKEYVFEAHKKDIAERKYSANISNRIILRPKVAVFADGKCWYKGEFMMRDPDNPNTWIIDKNASLKTEKTKLYASPNALSPKNTNLSNQRARCYAISTWGFAYCDEHIPCLYGYETHQRVDVGYNRTTVEIHCTDSQNHDCLGSPIRTLFIDEESECVIVSENQKPLTSKTKLALNRNAKKKRGIDTRVPKQAITSVK